MSVAASGDPSAVINWDFLSSQSLTSFSRTSNATLFDSTGKLTYAANNLILQSNAWDVIGSAWTNRSALASTLNDAGTLAPDGTQTATLLRATSSNGYIQQNGATSSAGKKITSFWIKRKTGTGNIDAVDAQANAWTPITVTSEWTRVSLVAASSPASQNWIGLRLQTSGDEVWVWGGQVELVTYQTTPSTYVATTTDPYYGPRYPYAYNGSTWDAQGLLVEQAGTNYFYPSIPTAASWNTINSVTLANNDAGTLAPDGSQTAMLVTATAANGFAQNNNPSAGGGQPKISSVWIKRKTGTGTVYIDDAGAGAWYAVTVGSDWTRVSVYIASSGTNNYGGIKLANNGDAVWVWGYQVEAGDQATSYIPTTSAAVTRNADTSLAFSAISLPTGLSFSRTSNAMQYDAAGRLTYAPHNILGYSEDFRDTATAGSTRPWTDAAVTIAANTGDTTAPDGTSTANKISEVANTGDHRVYLLDAAQQRASAYCVFSVYLKDFSAPNASQWVRLEGFDGGTANGQFVANFDLTNGVVGNNGKAGGGGSFIGAAIQSVGNGWYRCSIAYQQSSNAGGPSPNVGIYLLRGVGNIVVGGSTGYAGNTSKGIYAWGAQFEFVTYEDRARPYVKTVDANPVYGPRYDYDPTTRLPKGLLIEEARTNIQTYSEAFDNAAWTTSGGAATVTANQAIAPSGLQSADLLAADGTSAQHYVVQQTYPCASGTQYTFSLFVKRSTANFIHLLVTGSASYIQWSLTDGTVVYSSAGTGTLATPVAGTNVGNGWWRFVITFTQSTGVVQGTRIYPLAASQNTAGPSETSTASVYLWGAQVEAGAFPTSYIPTTSASVQRTADVANVTGASFSSVWNASAGTMIGEFAYFGAKDPVSSYARVIFEASDGSASNRYDLRSNSSDGTSKTSYSSTAGDFSTSGGSASGVPMRNALAYSAANWAASVNGGTAVAPSTPGASVPTVSRLTFGEQSGAAPNAWLRKFAYYKVRLSDTKLQQKSVVGATL